MPLLKSPLLTAAALATALSAPAYAAETAPITVNVDGVRNEVGAIVIAAFDNPDAFRNMDVTKAVALAQMPATGKTVSVTFQNMPKKKFAFAAMHDEDLDQVLDMSGGVPTEGYGFASMGPSGLPPKFEDAAVSAGKQVASVLRLKYWK